MNTCIDAMMTILKGHYVASACHLLGIDDPESKPRNLPDFSKMSAWEKYSFIINLSSEVLNNCGPVDAAILGQKVTETEDGIFNYARVFCHHASLALECLLQKEMETVFADVGRSCFYTFIPMATESMHGRHYAFSSN